MNCWPEWAGEHSTGHADIMCMPKLEIVVALSVTHTRSSDAHKYYEVTAFRLLTKCENIWQIDQWIILRLLLTCAWSEEPLRSVNILQADSRRKFTDNVCILRTIRKWCGICRWQINKIFHIWYSSAKYMGWREEANIYPNCSYVSLILLLLLLELSIHWLQTRTTINE